MTMDEYRAELRSRVAYLKNLYVQNKIKLKAGEGLCADLEVANALTQTGGTPRRDQANAAHVVWNLVEVIRPCVEAGLDVSNHLANITTGTTDYGVPADPNSKKRFYKDFEFELLITSSLIKKGLVPQLLGNDPRGELLIGNVFIEAKHPNKVSGIEKHMNKFNGKMKKSDSYGVFAVAIEDASGLGDSVFDNKKEHEQWFHLKLKEMLAFEPQLIEGAKRCCRIGGMVQIATEFEVEDGVSTLRRFSNAQIFDRPRMDTTCRQNIEAITKTFNPNPQIIRVA